jgi:hypothetical protein
MSKVVVTGMGKYSGEYDLGDRSFNAREWRWVKQMSGYLPLTISEGFAGMDADLMLAVAIIGMARDHKIQRDEGLEVWETMSEMDTTDASIILTAGDEVEDDPVPLDLTQPPVELSRTG